MLIGFYIAGPIQAPLIDATYGSLIFFLVQGLTDGSHKIDVTVMAASATNPYIIDYFAVLRDSTQGSPFGSGTSPSTPSSSSGSNVIVPATPIGAIVGGVVGGVIAIALLIFALWYFLKRFRGGQGGYFEKPPRRNTLVSECVSTSRLSYLAENVEGLPMISSRCYRTHCYHSYSSILRV